jgi:hypothetical protein
VAKTTPKMVTYVFAGTTYTMSILLPHVRIVMSAMLKSTGKTKLPSAIKKRVRMRPATESAATISP